MSATRSELQPESPPETPHLVVVTRWRERYAEYERYLDHGRHRVTYVTTEVGREAVPPEAAEVRLVGATDDVDAVRAAVADLAGRHGAPEAVVALKEDDLLVGALLREEWGCPGPRTADLLPLRDKGVMTAAIRDAGLPIPAFAPAPDTGAVAAFAAAYGWPVVVKPCVGSSSEGVVVVEGRDDLAGLRLGAEPHLVQAFCADPIHHVDGLFDGRGVPVVRSSRYLNDCVAFRHGSVLGSVEVDDPVVHDALHAAAERFLAALTDRPTVFHLEVFVGRTGSGKPVCRFLEVGARTGGAEIPFLWRELHGYDLMEAGTRIQLGQQPPPPPALPRVGGGEVGGWLLVPAPAERPCRITSVTDVRSANGRPGPYAQVVLRPGQVLPAADSYYEHVGGRFRFRGSDSQQVESTIRDVADRYRVEAASLAPVVGGSMPKDYSVPVLDGPGDNDYARYMRTDALLSLQRRPEEVVHRDELLFQTVHQSTELWLKHACFEVDEASRQVRAGQPDLAARLVARGALGVELVTTQLEMLRHLTPATFQVVRTALGHGSGFESPGWREVQRVSRGLGEAFDDLVAREGADLGDLYRGSPDVPLYRLAEALVEWDDRIAMWRARHYKIATRIIGHDVVGTKGTPVDTLTRLIAHKFFPELWRIRTTLTEEATVAAGAPRASCPVDHDQPGSDSEDAPGDGGSGSGSDRVMAGQAAAWAAGSRS